MKNIYIVLMAVLIALALAINAGATEAAEPMTEAITEAAETTTETVETMTEEVATEAPTQEDSEISAILNAATPEQIEHIKQYIIYGISTLPFPDQVRAFTAENLNAIAWIVAGVVFVWFIIDNRKGRKSQSDALVTNNNNLVDAYNEAKEMVSDAKKHTSEISNEVKRALAYAEEKNTAMLNEAKAITEKAVKVLEERSIEIFDKAKESTDAAIKAMEELKNRETGLTESEILMSKIISDLIQNSNLPQWKKDEFTVHLNEGMKKIAEVTEHDEEQA